MSETEFNAKYGPFVLFVAAVLGVDYAAPPMIAAIGPANAMPLAFTVAGAVAAQIGLVAMWGVFSSWRYMSRLGTCAAMGLACYGSFALGIVTAAAMLGERSPPVLLAFLTACPLVLFGVQLPLWAARIWLRWQVAERDDAVSGSYARAMQLKDAVVGSAAICVALALTRLAPMLWPEDDSADEISMGFTIMATVGAVASTGSLVPLLYFTLGARSVTRAALGVVSWFAIVLTLLTTLFAVAEGLTLATAAVPFLAVGSFAFLTCTGLGLVRASGYRLVRSKAGRAGDASGGGDFG